MDVSVSLQSGTLSYEISVSDTGPDGLREVQDRAVAIFLALAGEEACHEAAKAVPTIIDES